MHPATRTQAELVNGSGIAEFYTDLTSIDTSVEPDRARQEDKQGADINSILRRFGVGDVGVLAGGKKPLFGDVDYSMELQDAYIALDTAMQALRTLPVDLQKRYPTMQDLYRALAEGELTKYFTKPGTDPAPTPTPEPVP